jgi:hypothetical protein
LSNSGSCLGIESFGIESFGIESFGIERRNSSQFGKAQAANGPVSTLFVHAFFSPGVA